MASERRRCVAPPSATRADRAKLRRLFDIGVRSEKSRFAAGDQVTFPSPTAANFSTVGRMTNLPFGFSPSGDDDPEGKPGQGPGPGRLRPQPAGLDALPARPDDVAGRRVRRRRPARSTTTWPGRSPPRRCRPSHPASSIDVAKVADAIALAEVWLDGATSMPAGVRTSTAWTPRQWIDATMPTWEKLCSPIAEQVSRAWVDGLPERGEGAGRPAAGDDGLDGRDGLRLAARPGPGPAVRRGADLHRRRPAARPGGHRRAAAAVDRRVRLGPEPAGGPGAAVPGDPGGRPPPAVRRHAVAAGPGRSR